MIQAAYIVPHPPLAVPAVGGGRQRDIQDTLEAYDRVAAQIAELAPETLLLLSPHAPVYRDVFRLEGGEQLRGSFAAFGAPQAQYAVPCDTAFLDAVGRAAKGRKVPTLLEATGGLDHGAMVPLHFINSRYTGYRLALVSVSGRDLGSHVALGRCLREAAEGLGRRVVLVASGDLSHKLVPEGPYGFAPEGPEFDRQVTAAMKAGDFEKFLALPEALCENAGECGLRAFAALAGALEGRAWQPEFMSYEGPFGVGYAVCGYRPKDPYVALARQALETFLKTGETIPPPLPEPRQAGVFVSIKKHGELRGCIGTIQPCHGSVAHEIIENAIAAGTKDPRFPPVTLEEWDALTFSVDVLSPPEAIPDASGLDVKKYGVIVRQGYRRGLLLPNLEGVDTVAQQVAIALQKAGIPPTAPYQLERFQVVRHT
jgi:AmmeMemoRadiSam system protein A/AmmeMemoRadiSam system protein B